MSETEHHRARLAEVVAAYGADAARAPHGKISISLPRELLEQVRSIAAESGLSVSAVIAAAIRIAGASELVQLDASIQAQNESRLEWVQAYAGVAARSSSTLEFRRPTRPFVEIRDRSYPAADWPVSSTQLLLDERGTR